MFFSSAVCLASVTVPIELQEEVHQGRYDMVGMRYQTHHSNHYLNLGLDRALFSKLRHLQDVVNTFSPLCYKYWQESAYGRKVSLHLTAQMSLSCHGERGVVAKAVGHWTQPSQTIKIQGSSSQPHFLQQSSAIQGFQTAPFGGQVFKPMSLWEAFNTQTTA